MLAISLAVATDGSDVLVLPVRAATDPDDAAPALVATAPPPADEVRTEAEALLPVTRLTGRAGETLTQLRPGRYPGAAAAARRRATAAGRAWRTAGAALARAAVDETHVTLVLPVDGRPGSSGHSSRGCCSPRTGSDWPRPGRRPALAG